MQQLLGISIILGCVFGGFLLMGGNLKTVFEPVEILVIVGSAVGALVVGNPKHVIKELLAQIKRVMKHSKSSIAFDFEKQLLLLMYELLQVGRDLKALDVHVEAPQESPLFQRYPQVLASPKLMSFIVDNFRLMAMGKISPHELEAVLEQEIESIHSDMEQPSKSLKKISEAMPGFGIVAAVLGIVMALNTVSQGASAGEIAHRVGAAMVGTFLGIFFCYGVLDPLSNVISQSVNAEMTELECIKVVLVAFSAGKPALLAIDAGRRVLQTTSKPSFLQVETWINELGKAT